MRAWQFAAAVLSLALAPAVATAQNFRVETDVFVGNKKPQEPVAEYLTLFDGASVYDFALSDTKEVTIYYIQKESEKFVLLDPDRRIKAELSLDELRAHTANLKAEAANSGDANVQFLVNPVFEVTVKEPDRLITLVSKQLTYTAKGIVPREEGVCRRYAAFADGYARLNGLRLGNMPPFARMQLNEKLLELGWVPEEVTRTIPAQAVLAKDVEVRSHHLFSWRILPTDEKKIAEAHNYKATFKPVSLAEYLKWPQKVAKSE